jgi:aldose 1-epimerase
MQVWGDMKGKPVYEYVMKNAGGLEVGCLNYGCAITKMIVPDRYGKFENIVLGFEDLAGYLQDSCYYGVIVGRVAGRIKDGQFVLEGKNHTLARNNGKNHLHGGVTGFHNIVWEAETAERNGIMEIRFSCISRDGEEGYPGTLRMEVLYSLNDNNEFTISYRGQADKTTLLNPTNHTYFNLSGNMKRSVLQHSLLLGSSRFVEVDEQLLPTGRLVAVDGSVFDFRNGRQISEGIESFHRQNRLVGNGYDHCFVLDHGNLEDVVLWERESGRKITVKTAAGGVVLYTGNFLPDQVRDGKIQSRKHWGLCLETQELPDSIHHAHFPSCILEEGKVFSSDTKYTFDIMERTGKRVNRYGDD